MFFWLFIQDNCCKYTIKSGKINENIDEIYYGRAFLDRTSKNVSDFSQSTPMNFYI